MPSGPGGRADTTVRWTLPAVYLLLIRKLSNTLTSYKFLFNLVEHPEAQMLEKLEKIEYVMK